MKEISHSTWFLGPKGEYSNTWEQFMVYILRDHVHWRRNYFPSDNVVIPRGEMRENEEWMDCLNSELDKILAQFKSNNPHHSPRYLAHMISEQTLPSVLGYLAGVLYNSNNIDGESSPAAVPMELKVGEMVASMIGYDPTKSWTHITSGGTVANIEALWVSRTIKFIPFVVREFCEKHNIALHITTPNGESHNICEIDNTTMLALAPECAIRIVRTLIRHLVEECGWELEQAHIEYEKVLYDSDFNIIRSGLPHILAKLGVEPVIFASPSAHYSIKKAANLLGYGERAVKIIDVDHNFRLDTHKLKQALQELAPNQYLAAVVAIVGTTEEGAIDPVHRIAELRDELHKSHNRSFWLHIDSAWGGYVRSLFCGYDVDHTKPLSQQIATYRKAINTPTGYDSNDILWEHDPQIYTALNAFSLADSVTVDPHKLGYIPYAAGVVSFKNSIVTEHIKQEAPYVFRGGQYPHYNDHPVITNVGGFILEGSKPGAAAAACYLAHKTIPLTLHGHGKMIKSTLQSALKLHRLFTSHFASFDHFEHLAMEKMHMEGITPTDRQFTIVPLHNPDTNLLCYVLRAVVSDENSPSGWRIDPSFTLEQANAMVEKVYLRMTKDHKELRSSLSYDYFVSKTRFVDRVYKYETLHTQMNTLGINKEEYQKHGLFVLRTTVMNPFYQMARNTNQKNYLEEYVACLHANIHAALAEL